MTIPTANPVAKSPPPSITGTRHLSLGIGLAVATAIVWSACIRPMERRLAQASAELRNATSGLSAFQQATATQPSIDSTIQTLADQASAKNTWTRRSGDPTKLYDAIHSLADAHAVRIDRVEPGTTRVAKADSDTLLSTEVFSYTVEFNGTYPDVASFIDACERELGATKIASFHLAPQVAGPALKDPRITATIETQHLKLVIPGVGAPPVNGSAAAGETISD